MGELGKPRDDAMRDIGDSFPAIRGLEAMQHSVVPAHIEHRRPVFAFAHKGCVALECVVADRRTHIPDGRVDDVTLA
ncbi:hypothetical protein SDC9_103037 [bioreactor metagenome]|uniref:Uncharacterized protein n=1 Tax=bioreactor metagenome TaxID=1076179 RepID=A0A645ASI1_9ZZZZ